MSEAHESFITGAIVISVGLGVALSLWLILSIGLNEVLEVFRGAPSLLIGVYLLVSLLIAVALTVKWSVVLDAYGVKLPFYTLFIYRLIGFAVSYVTPTAHVGGEPVRALLLKKQGIPLKIGFATAIVDRSIELLFNVVLFFVGAVVIANITSFPVRERLFTIVVSIFAVLGAAFIVFSIIDKRKILVPLLERFGAARLPQWSEWRSALNETELLIEHFYANRRGHFLAAVTINALLWALMFLEYKFALLILGYDAGLFGIFVFLTGVGIAYSIPIPAALGVLELGQITAATILSAPPALAVALALVIRTRDLLWSLIGIVLLSAFHMNVLRLFERSQKAAKQHNFAMLQVELRGLRRQQKQLKRPS